MTCLLLFYEFFKTGLFAVGGGLATLPFLYDMAARHPEWFTVSQLADMLAVSESRRGHWASTWPPMWATSPPGSPAPWRRPWDW